MDLVHDNLPVLAVAIVILSMVGVDLWIIGDPVRVLSVIPILLFLLLWMAATIRVRRREM